MKEKKKKSLKGMTLMECIIAVAVLAALGMLVVVGGVSAVTNLRAAHSVSEKNAVQSGFASARMENASTNTGTMHIYLDGNTANHVDVNKYEVKENESSDDKVGNYRYFELQPTTSPT